MDDQRDALVAAFVRRAATEQEARSHSPANEPPERTRSADDPWPMRVITHGEAEWAYEQRRYAKRPLKQIATELGKSWRSTARAISYVALERKTYGEEWARERRAHRLDARRWFMSVVRERDRQFGIAKQSAAEHAAAVELTRAALDSPPPKETRQEREERAEALAMSGTVPIVVSADDGNAVGNERGREALRRSPSEREARRKARRIRQMLGPTATAEELGL